jgi:hypothetical protein
MTGLSYLFLEGRLEVHQFYSPTVFKLNLPFEKYIFQDAAPVSERVVKFVKIKLKK